MKTYASSDESKSSGQKKRRPQNEEAWIKEALKDTSASPFSLRNFCFKEQYAFITDPSPFKTAVCSRRSGKTVACAAHLIHEATTKHGRVVLYITLSRLNAKRIIWSELLSINQRYILGGIPNETELSLFFPETQSTIYLSGAKDKSEIEKFRGLALSLVYIDEVQSFRAYISDLINDVIEPALMDYAGTLCLIGTPGPVPAGFFHDCAHSDAWAHHAWTFWQNPFISLKSGQSHQEILDRTLKRRGVQANHPSIQREWFGRWILDSDSLLISYSQETNHYSELPAVVHSYMLGIDVGFDDADALAVMAWNDVSKNIYLVEEQITHKQGLTELVHQIQALNSRYNFTKMIMDEGALGKKMAEEMRRRHELPIMPADKQRKWENVRFMNDALRTGVMKAKKDSRFAQDSYLLEIDQDKTTEKRIVIKDTFHSDICFVAGTQILTSEGEKPIECVNVGELVLTRKGYRRVLASCLTREKTEVMDLHFSTGVIITATPNHPFYTSNRGFIRADALLYADEFVTSEQCVKELQKKALLSGSMENRSFGTLNPTGPISENTSGLMPMAKGIHCTEQFGFIILEKFQKAVTFIIKTAMHLIIPSKIWNASLLTNTGINTAPKLLKRDLKTQQQWIKPEKLLRLGTALQRVFYGIRGTLRAGVRKIEKQFLLFATHVGPLTSVILWPAEKLFTAPVNAQLRLDETQDLMTPSLHADFAQKNLSETNTLSPSTAVTLVRRERVMQQRSVYNLTVEDQHEYFANGILVSNCDAVLYAFKESPAYQYVQPIAKPAYRSPEWMEAEVERMEAEAVEYFTKLEKLEMGEY